MPDHTKPSEKEDNLTDEIAVFIANIKKFKAERNGPANRRQLRLASGRLEVSIGSWIKEATARISKIQDPTAKQAAKIAFGTSQQTYDMELINVQIEVEQRDIDALDDDDTIEEETPAQKKHRLAEAAKLKQQQEEERAKLKAKAKAQKLLDLAQDQAKEVVASVKGAQTKLKAEPKEVTLTSSKVAYYNNAMTSGRSELADTYQGTLSQILELSEEVYTEAKAAYMTDLKELKAVVDEIQATLATYEQELTLSGMVNQNRQSSLNGSMDMQELSRCMAAAFSSHSSSRESSSTRTNKRTYRINELPRFHGDVHKYAEWKREWVTAIIPHEEEEWCVRYIDKNTPDTDNLGHYTTLAELWKDLDAKYCNPTAVSESLIQEFLKMEEVEGDNDDQRVINLKTKISVMLKRLQTVGQEAQLLDVYHVVGHAMKLMPSSYQKDISAMRRRMDNAAKEAATGLMKDSAVASARSLWQAFIESMDEECAVIRSYRAHNLTKSTKPRKDKDLKGKGGKGGSGGGGGGATPRGLNHLDKAKKKKYTTALHKDPVIKAAQESFGPCPGDGGHHTYVDRNGKEKASNKLNDCPKWAEMTVDERVKVVLDNNCCSRCSSWGHTKDNCTAPASFKCVVKKADGTPCGGNHHAKLHDSKNPQIINVMAKAVNCQENDEVVVLHIVKVKLKRGKVETLVFMDTGSTCSLITHALARQLNLSGESAMEWVQLAGRDPELIPVMHYTYDWYYAPGRVKRLNLIGLDSITAHQTDYNVDIAYQLFPHIPKGSIDRSAGEVGILLGQDVASLLPRGGEGRDTCGDLYVMRIPFGSGYVLGGTHPDIAAAPSPWSANAQLWRSAVFPERKINHVNFVRKPNLCTCCAKSCNTVVKPPTFWDGEDLGVATPRRCRNCSSCAICNITDEGRTVQEQVELQMLEQTVKHDPVRKKVKVGYPLIGDTSQFKDNRRQADQLSEGLWKSLKAKGQLDQYCEQFQAYIDRGALVPVTEEMIKAWKEAGGTINYISHHGVANDHSATTPLRLVCNSALPNSWSGPTPNSVWAKGPNSLNNLLDVLLRFRSYDVALVFDLSKAYHRLETGPQEMFMRLVRWRFDESQPWQTWGYACVGMGDRPAACLLELAKKLGAEIAKMTDEEAAMKLVKDGYVDDILTGSKLADVLRMMGDVTKSKDGSYSYSGTMARILSEIGFSPKVMVRSYEQDPEVLSKMTRVLGVPWDASVDVMVYQLVLNLSKRVGASKLGPDLLKDDLETIKQIMFTRRKCLQVVSQIFDPIGLLVAYTIKLKLRLKEAMSQKLGWDEAIDKALQALWRDLVNEVVNSEPVTFPRSFKCADVVEQCELVGLWDGSSVAFGGMVLARWKYVGRDGWYCCLVTAKARVHPSSGLTIPRSELQGLVVLVRIIDAVYNSLPIKPSRITMLGDSSCTLGVVELSAGSLKTFCSNRSLEINTTMRRWGRISDIPASQEDTRDRSETLETIVDLLHHIPGNLNTSDLLTRDTVMLSDIGAGSEWQHGPAFLSEDRSTWPVKRESYVKAVPKEEIRKTSNIALNAMVKLEDIDEDIKQVERLMAILTYSYQLNKVRGIMARLCRASKLRCKLTLSLPLDVADYEAGDKFILWLSMMFTTRMMKQKNMDYLTPFFVGGVWYTHGRIPPDQLKQQTGHTALVLLSTRSPLATLVVWAAHSQDHRKSPGDTMVRVMAMGYWIPHGRKLAATVAKFCPKCRTLSSITAQQRMAQYPPERFEIPTRPFSMICIDFAAPLLIKDTLKRRVSGRRAVTAKVFPLLVVCLHTGSVHPLVCTGYSAADLLLQLEGLFALRGYPSVVITDLGSQLTATGKMMAGDGTEDVVQGEQPIDWKHVQAQTVARGMKWIHACSGAQWRNGKSEAMMKALKWSLKHMQDGDLRTYPETQVQMLRAGHIVNDRPLGIRHFGGADPDWDVVTPNMLLTGSMNLDSPDPDRYLLDNSIHTRRLHFMEQQFRAWWEAWYRSVFQSLLPLTRWKTASRNVAVGDIVLVLHKKKLGGPGYRYARVSAVHPDSAGLVRTVTIQYRPRDSRGKLLPYTSKRLEEQTMAVQRLVVLLAVEERDTAMCPEVGDTRPRNLFTESDND